MAKILVRLSKPGPRLRSPQGALLVTLKFRPDNVVKLWKTLFASIVDDLICFADQIQQPQAAALIRMCQPLSIRRRMQIQAVNATVLGQFFSFSYAIGRKLPDLVFTR